MSSLDSLSDTELRARAEQSEAPRPIKLDQIWENPKNPRKQYSDEEMQALVASIEGGGFQSWKPLVVFEHDDQPANGETQYVIAAGHRRFKAAMIAGLEEVPCSIIPQDKVAEVLYFDNDNREDLHPYEQTMGWIAWMSETGATVVDLAKKTGLAENTLHGRLKYADLIDEARDAFLANKFGARHAELIARQDPELQERCLWYVVESATPISSRHLADFIANSKPAPPPPPAPSPRVDSIPAESPRTPEPPRPAPRVETPAPASEANPDEAPKPPAEDKQAKIRQIAYQRVVEAICAKITWPPAKEDIFALVETVVESFEGWDEIADMFKIDVKFGESVGHAVSRSLYRLSGVELVRIGVAGVLFDVGSRLNWNDSTTITSVAGAHKVDRVKIYQQVEKQLKEAEGGTVEEVAKLSAKSAIATLPTLDEARAPKAKTPAKKAAPAKSAPKAAAAKKNAKAVKKGVAKKGGKKWLFGFECV